MSTIPTRDRERFIDALQALRPDDRIRASDDARRIMRLGATYKRLEGSGAVWIRRKLENLANPYGKLKFERSYRFSVKIVTNQGEIGIPTT